MSPYRPISVDMWDDAKFVALSVEAKLLWVCVLAGPHTRNLPGLAVVGLGALSDTMRMKPSVIEKVFAELLASDLIQYDERTRVLRIPNAPRYNPPANANVVRGWRKTFDRIPDCPLKHDHIESLRTAANGSAVSKAFAQHFGANGSGNGSPNGSGNGSTKKHDTTTDQTANGSDHVQGTGNRDQGSPPKVPPDGSTDDAPTERASGGFSLVPDKPPTDKPGPAPGLAERLRDAWCSVTGQPLADVPVTAKHQAAAKRAAAAFGDDARVDRAVRALAADPWHRKRGFGACLAVDALHAGLVPRGPVDSAALSRPVHESATPEQLAREAADLERVFGVPA